MKNECIYEVASLKSSTLLDKLQFLHSFIFRDLAEVSVAAFYSLRFITDHNGCLCIFAMK